MGGIRHYLDALPKRPRSVSKALIILKYKFFDDKGTIYF